MTYKKELLDLQQNTLEMIRTNADSKLTYHNFDHTLDVKNSADAIARAEGIPEEDILLLTTAAVFHDAGYLYGREKHEEKSCKMAKEAMAKIPINDIEVEKICQTILATKIPHRPEGKLQEILCDADLDYLGRDDYFIIAEKVFQEFLNDGTVNNRKEWDEMQIRFLESHRYFTDTSIRLRERKKNDHLSAIRSRISSIQDL